MQASEKDKETYNRDRKKDISNLSHDPNIDIKNINLNVGIHPKTNINTMSTNMNLEKGKEKEKEKDKDKGAQVNESNNTFPFLKVNWYQD